MKRIWGLLIGMLFVGATLALADVTINQNGSRVGRVEEINCTTGLTCSRTGQTANFVVGGSPTFTSLAVTSTSSAIPLKVTSSNTLSAEMEIQNTNATAGSSSDIVAESDNGTETTNYVDLGINGSSGAPNTFGTGANEAYLYASDYTLDIGAPAVTNGSIKFYTGGGQTAPTQRAVITNAGNIGVGTSVPTSALQVGPATITALGGGIGLFGISTSSSLEIDQTLYVDGAIYPTGGAGLPGVTNTATTTCGCKTFKNGICTVLGTCS